LRIVTLTEPRPERNLRGKPGALDAGISASTGEIILMTDADCIVPSGWIAAIAAQFDNSRVGLTASFTEIRPGNIFESMQAIEWTLTHSMALAGVGLRQPLGCFGNNLAVRRSVYEALGGFAGIRFSVTEDLALLQAVFAAGHEIRYVCHKNAAVETAPCTTFGEYIRQHHRWARGGLGLGWRATVFIILSATLAVSLAVAVYSEHYALLPLIVAIRAIGDNTIIYPSLRALNRTDLYFSSVYSVLFLMALEMFIPILALIPSVRWKGQIFR
jgi:cellulose synthase/poly-beta-1,6-N-acetylglucosamine synthase-like glycosyltransferase